MFPLKIMRIICGRDMMLAGIFPATSHDFRNEMQLNGPETTADKRSSSLLRSQRRPDSVHSEDRV